MSVCVCKKKKPGCVAISVLGILWRLEDVPDDLGKLLGRTTRPENTPPSLYSLGSLKMSFPELLDVFICSSCAVGQY